MKLPKYVLLSSARSGGHGRSVLVAEPMHQVLGFHEVK
jgi:hypothetical protein